MALTTFQSSAILTSLYREVFEATQNTWPSRLNRVKASLTWVSKSQSKDKQDKTKVATTYPAGGTCMSEPNSAKIVKHVACSTV